ncbi:hypothetical protein G3I60_42830 [Streptomyces sp. SID13666]|uniref:hypothetical protein n=1 Tax=unclassified Streptomyces TaxID=2593676 RepID=UPI0013C0A546|nr:MULTISPECIES: hypothetical protein [unclassified Streptomyces]MCZ4098966.1 hypothetical protein [Streptomyces sp. H39-C1]NEA60726.1 hypothetical protein [Streptomyces sp. SID13666]
MIFRDPTRGLVFAGINKTPPFVPSEGDRTVMAVYQHQYGILAEGSLDGWQETDSAAEITATEFERNWTSGREGITGGGDR